MIALVQRMVDFAVEQFHCDVDPGFFRRTGDPREASRRIFDPGLFGETRAAAAAEDYQSGYIMLLR